MQKKRIITRNEFEAQVNAISEYVEAAPAETNDPLVYCGTYYKYAKGSLLGEWLNLARFADYDEFIEVCRRLHADEEDPELMFQDYQNFPSEWYDESDFEDDFDNILEYANMDDDKRRAFEAYVEATGNDSIRNFEDNFEGEFDDEEDYARFVVEEYYPEVLNAMGSLEPYFDYGLFARDLFSSEFVFESGYVFRL